MKLFVVNVEDWEYDFVDSVVVLANDKDKAIELAIEFDDFFENNIGEVDEICLTEQGIVHESIIHG